jgi:hypothetical protein
MPNKTLVLNNIILTFFLYDHTTTTKTERCGQVVNTPALYLRGPGLKSRTRDWLSSLRLFMVLLSPSWQMPR